MRLAAAIALLLAASPAVLSGQRARAPGIDGVLTRSGTQPPGPWHPPPTVVGGLAAAQDSAERSSPWSVLASAALPGSGQAILGQGRAIVYLALEAYAWTRYAADVRAGRRARSEYRRLASEVARRPFSEDRPTGSFEYYETMEKYVESGAYDLVPGDVLDPEQDTTTANGATWLLARETFWSDPWAPPARDTPEYARAEEFYRERAVRPEYRWSWRNAALEYAEFQRTIRRSNNAYRESLQNLGVIIANHTLSTVDAFVTIRLRSHRTGASGSRAYEVMGSIPLERLPRLR